VRRRRPGTSRILSKDTFHGRTPLSWAAEMGYEAVVKALLARITTMGFPTARRRKFALTRVREVETVTDSNLQDAWVHVFMQGQTDSHVSVRAFSHLSQIPSGRVWSSFRHSNSSIGEMKWRISKKQASMSVWRTRDPYLLGFFCEFERAELPGRVRLNPCSSLK
jgi:hypothetical protein